MIIWTLPISSCQQFSGNQLFQRRKDKRQKAMTSPPTLSSKQMEAKASHEARILSFFKRQFVTPIPAPPNIVLHGKTAIVTGANSGLGFESSRQLLRLGLSRLMVAARSQARGDVAAEKLQAEFPSADIQVWILDMDSYESVRDFAARCRREVGDSADSKGRNIDIAILNAGCQGSEYETSSETKHERVFQVNYLSTMLLTILLLPILKDSQRRRKAEEQGRSDLVGDPETKKSYPDAPSVISVVTSDTAYTSSLNSNSPSIFAQLDRAPPDYKYISFSQYARTKLLQQSFIPKLAECVDPDDVVLNLVNPGLCRDTAFNDGAMSGVVLILYHVFMSMVSRTLEVGASTYIDAAVVKGRESHGSLVSDWSLKPFPPILYGESGRRIQDQLWEETMNEFELAGAREIIAGLMD